jgi:hypothetical protein
MLRIPLRPASYSHLCLRGLCLYLKERERKIATIQNQCRWLRGVERLEIQKVARTIGPARMREIAVTRTRE